MSGGPLIAAAAATSSSSIWSAVERACRRAKSSGAIKTIGTQPVVTKQGLVLRVAEHLKDKPKPRLPTAGSERSAAAEPFDPFRRENLEEDLVVCDLGSEVGTIVNGARIAANEHSTTASLLHGNNLVSTGTLHSRFRFSIVFDRT